MAGRFVRQSSYRHVFGTPAKEIFAGVRPSLAGDTGYIAGNGKFFALPLSGGGGPVQVQPLTATGRLGLKVPMISVHKSPVLDVIFNPYIDTQILTGGDDGYIKITNFPEAGITDEITECARTLEGHQKKIIQLAYNPVANNILASASADARTLLWDVEAGSVVQECSYDGDNNSVMSVAWNNNGSLVATTCKDKLMRIYDPRDSKAVAAVPCNSGSKKNTVVFADNLGKIIGVTFSKTSTRQLQVWDAKNLEKPLSTSDIDSSAGVFVTYYDPDNTILWLAGKGDGTIKYFEMVKEEPYQFFLTEYRDNNSQKGACFLPKRSCDTKKCEIARCLRLMANEVIPVSFQVPRKSDLFQKDLYPDAYAGVPALTAAEFKDGKNAEPVVISMKPGEAEKVEHKKVVATFSKTPAEYEAEITALKAKVAELEAALAKK